MNQAALPQILATTTDDGRYASRVHNIHLTGDALFDIVLAYKWAGLERARCLAFGSALIDSEWQTVLCNH